MAGSLRDASRLPAFDSDPLSVVVLMILGLDNAGFACTELETDWAIGDAGMDWPKAKAKVGCGAGDAEVNWP
jgi:hypothetical protein